jgi:hypothetical protein
MPETKKIEKVNVPDNQSELNKKSVETKEVNGRFDARSKEYVQNNERKGFKYGASGDGLKKEVTSERQLENKEQDLKQESEKQLGNKSEKLKKEVTPERQLENKAEKAEKARPGWSNDQQKYLRQVAKMSREEAQKLGIPSNIHGYLVNERDRANKMARLIRKEGSVEAVKKKIPNIETTNKGLRSPFKGQYDVGHKKAHVMGGSNKLENLRFELASDNRAKGPRERIVNNKIKARKEVNDPEN